MTISLPEHPLLSICVFTYKRPQFLKVMLEALLPQAALAANQVEVWIVINGADDETINVVEAARQFGPLKYLPKPLSERRLESTSKVICEVLSGEFLWLLSDHNLMAPGALPGVLGALGDQPHLDAFYVNFRCATYPEHWPASARGGYSGPYHYMGSPELEDRRIHRWEELIRPESALCTQQYAHIFRRMMWVNYWRGHRFGEVYTSAQTTYPHTYLLAETMFGRPSYYIGSPAVTIFNGAQSWSAEKDRVYLIGLPELLNVYRRHGLPREQMRAAYKWGSQQAYCVLLEMFRDFSRPQLSLMLHYVRRSWAYTGTWHALWRSFMDSQCCWLPRLLRNLNVRFDRFWRYWFQNCRPARWVRAHMR